MKHFSKFLWITVAMFSMTFASCSNNEDEPEPIKPGEPTTSEVFPMGLPSNVNGASIVVNDKGQVTKIVTEDNTEITFEYGNFSRATKFDVMMKIRDLKDHHYDQNIYMQLNKQGFVSNAVIYDLENQVEEISDYCTWNIEYNTDNQVTHFVASYFEDGIYDGNIEYILTYENGDLTKSIETETDINEDGTDEKRIEFCDKIFYTNSIFKQPIENKCGIMLFEECFKLIHLYCSENLNYIYYAGLLGKATKNLPMSFQHGYWEDDDECEEPDVEHEDGWCFISKLDEYQWEFNDKQFPIKFIDDYDDYVATFRWK